MSQGLGTGPRLRNAALGRPLAQSGHGFVGVFNPQSKDVPWITRCVTRSSVPLQGEEEHGVRAVCFGDESQPVPAVQKQDDAEHNPGQNNLHAPRSSADTVGFKSTREEVSTTLMSIYS